MKNIAIYIYDSTGIALSVSILLRHIDNTQFVGYSIIIGKGAKMLITELSPLVGAEFRNRSTSNTFYQFHHSF